MPPTPSKNQQCLFSAIALLIILMATPMLEAADRLVPLGNLLGHFDVYRNASTPSKRTFPDNVGHCLGGTALENGDVAMLFRTELSPPDHIATIYTLRLNPANYEAFQIIGPGLSLTYDANPELFFAAGPTPYGSDKYALIGYWQEVVGERVNHHWYLMTCGRTDGRATMLCELSMGATDICFVPGNGRQEDYFMISAGATNFYRINSLGTILGSVPTAGLHINTSPANLCGLHSTLTMTTNQDFLALRSDDRYDVSDCSSWINFSCIRFDADGNFKGAWDFGRTIARADRLPEDIEPIIALPNGDLISSHFYAYVDVRDNDRNGGTYRFYVLRPPDELHLPQCQVTPSVLTLSGQPLGATNQGVARVSNVGASALSVTDITIEGANASLFQVAGPRSFQLAPSYGQQDVPGTFQDITIYGQTTRPGTFAAKLAVASNDPQNPIVKADLSMVGYSESFKDTLLLEAAALPNAQAIFAGSGGQDLLIARAETSANGTGFVQVLKVPFTRNASNQITALNPSAATVVADKLPATVRWMEQGLSNQLWYGPVQTGASASPTPKWGIAQRKPDGTEFVQELKFWESFPCLDAEWTPDHSALLVVLESLRAPLRCLATPRADGFFDLAIKASLNNCAIADPNPLTAITVLPNSKQQLLLAYSTYSAAATLFRGWTTNFWLGTETCSPATGMVVAASIAIRQISLDPLTGSCLYLALDGSLHRLDGLREAVLWPASIPFKIKRVSQDAFYGSVWTILEWENLGLPVAVESSANLRQWQTISSAGTGYQRYLEATNSPVFYRLRLEDGR